MAVEEVGQGVSGAWSDCAAALLARAGCGTEGRDLEMEMAFLGARSEVLQLGGGFLLSRPRPT